jgi:transposase
VGRIYTDEFKEQIVALHLHRRRTLGSIAKEFDLSATTVANWVRAAERAADQKRGRSGGAADEESDSERIVRLERELAKKEEEVEILGKALAFFARRSER